MFEVALFLIAAVVLGVVIAMLMIEKGAESVEGYRRDDCETGCVGASAAASTREPAEAEVEIIRHVAGSR